MFQPNSVDVARKQDVPEGAGVRQEPVRHRDGTREPRRCEHGRQPVVRGALVEAVALHPVLDERVVIAAE